MLRIAGKNIRELTLPFGDKMKYLIGLLLLTLSQFAIADEDVNLEQDINEYASNIRSYSIESSKLKTLLNDIPNCFIKSIMNTNQSNEYYNRINTTIIYIDSDECKEDFNKVLLRKQKASVIENKSQKQKHNYLLGFLVGILILLIIYAVSKEYLKNKEKEKNDTTVT